MSLERTINGAFPADVADELLDVVGRVRSDLERAALECIARDLGGEAHTVTFWAVGMAPPEAGPLLYYRATMADRTERTNVLRVEVVTEPDPEPAWTIAVG